MTTFTWPNNGTGGGSGGGGVVTATLYDGLNTTLPSSAPLVIDGVTVTTGDTVLFGNLLTGNNSVYTATVSGPVVSWVVSNAFNGGPSPSAGSLITITEGNTYGGQIGYYTGTTWTFSNVVQYFSTISILNNTTNGIVFSIPFANSQNIIVDYSVVRNSVKQAGVITLTTDGITVGISSGTSTTGNNGVSFSSAIVGSNIVLYYTSTNSGFAGNMTYAYTAWSDSPGGPGALNSATLVNNSSGNIFTRPYANAQNLLIYYSVSRTAKETGTMVLTTDGTTAAIHTTSSDTGTIGVTFTASVSGGNILLDYATSNTGQNASMTYSIKSWSDAAGSMTSFIGGGAGSTSPAGADEGIQFNQSGSFGSSSNFNYDYANNLLLLGSKQISILQSTTFLDNQVSPVTLFSMPSTFNSVFLNYTVIRGVNTRSGTIQVSTDGTVGLGSNEYYAESGSTGFILSVALLAGNINFNYTSTSTGSGGTFKYSFERW